MAIASLSYAEKVFVLHGVDDNVRNDGRSRTEFRSFEVETNTVSNASGSARVRLANTDIIVGVKAELGVPSIEHPDEGRLEFFVDCSANAAPEFEGRGGEELATDISNMLARAYADGNALDKKKLCVAHGQHCWVLYVDVLLLECGGNLYDAASIAVKSALFDTKIPNLELATNEEGQVEIDLSDDPFDYYELDVKSCPLLITCSKIGKHHMVDCSPEEEACCHCHLIVSVTQSGHVTCTKKIGDGCLYQENVVDMCSTAKDVGIALNKALLNKLCEEAAISDRKPKGFLR